MTSRKSSFDKVKTISLMKEDAKRRLWPIALGLLANIFALPVYCALQLNEIERSIAGGYTTLEEARFSIYQSVLSFGNVPVVLVLCLMALINGIMGVSYMHSKVKTDLYNSLPFSRRKLLDAVFINGISIFAIPYILMHFITVVVVMARGYIGGDGLLYSLLSVIVTIIFYTAIYALVVLASVVCANTVVSIFAAPLFVTLPMIYYGVFLLYRTTFFVTYHNAIGQRSSVLGFSFPLGGLIEAITRLNLINEISLGKGTAGFTFLYLIFAVAVYLLTRYIVVKRPAEKAGSAIAFNKTKPYIKILVMIPAVLAFALLFFELGSNKIGWYVFGVVVGLILGHAISEIIFEFDFKACFKRLGSLGIATLLTAAVASIFIFDIFGYESYVPSDDNIESVAISCLGLQSRLEYYLTYEETKEIYNGTVPDSYLEYMSYLDPAEVRLFRMKLKEKSDFKDLVAKGIDTVTSRRLEYLTDNEDNYLFADVFDQNHDANSNYTQISVKYNLKNGKAIYRDYVVDFADEEALSSMERIFADEDYKEGTFPELVADNADIGKLYFVDPVGEIGLEAHDEILEAYREDLRDLKLKDLNKSYPVGKVVSRIIDERYGPFETTDQYNMFIYSDFTKTIACLEKEGVKINSLYDSAEKVSGVDIYDYNEAGYSNVSYDDPEDISKILGNLIYTDYYFMNPIMMEKDEKTLNTYVDISFSSLGNGNNQKGNTDTFVSGFNFLPGKAPEFVLKDIEENRFSE